MNKGPAICNRVKKVLFELYNESVNEEHFVIADDVLPNCVVMSGHIQHGLEVSSQFMAYIPDKYNPKCSVITATIKAPAGLYDKKKALNTFGRYVMDNLIQSKVILKYLN